MRWVGLVALFLLGILWACSECFPIVLFKSSIVMNGRLREPRCGAVPQSWKNHGWIDPILAPRLCPATEDVSLPMWPLIVLIGVPTGLAFMQRRRRHQLPGYCPTCGYNLTGNTSGVCPECGDRIVASPAAVLDARPGPTPDQQ